MDLFIKWFEQQGWKPWPFQLNAWEAYQQGKSGLITVPTGSGKSYAAFFGPLFELYKDPKEGIQILYITPLRALARDLEAALRRPLLELNLPFKLESRTGDTSPNQRLKQKKNPPEILLTTPESLALLLTVDIAKQNFAHLRCIIVDEWHELVGSKRGVMLELLLRKLQSWTPNLAIWGISATLGNPNEAAQVLLGRNTPYCLIDAALDREVIIDTILPEKIDDLPWAGMLGLKMLPYVIKELDPGMPTLIFTNTRSQAERWHAALVNARPEWALITAIHHSSIEKDEREQIEEGVKSGRLKFIVCTSSLDLGIDFSPVEKVIQIGSPKSIARLIQRAGRSSHQPMRSCHIAIVPTHILELVEIKAIRVALMDHVVEQRIPLKHSYDVLLQHLMSSALGGGFSADIMFNEVKKTYAFEDLSREQFDSCLNFLCYGGSALEAYPEYHKLSLVEGMYRLLDKRLAQRHRMHIGTIPSNPLVKVQFLGGKSIGDIEESFIAKLHEKECFFFAGRYLELVQFRDMTAYVRQSKAKEVKTPVWLGGHLPLSGPVSSYIRKVLTDNNPSQKVPENHLLQEAFKIQKKLSYLPDKEELLIEIFHTREGWHHYVYLFEGRLVHEGLAAILLQRIAKLFPGTYASAVNDYGLEISCRTPIPLTIELVRLWLDPENLFAECTHTNNFEELALRRFRDIARIAGLIFPGYLGKVKSIRQVQASSGLLFKVLKSYDPHHLLLMQAYEEVLEQQIQFPRLQAALERAKKQKIVIKKPAKLTPLALPLYLEKISGRLSTEALITRIQNIKAQWRQKNEPHD